MILEIVYTSVNCINSFDIMFLNAFFIESETSYTVFMRIYIFILSLYNY